MQNIISPRYKMQLIEQINKRLFELYQSYQKVEMYIEEWREYDISLLDYRFTISRNHEGNLNLLFTLKQIDIDSDEILF